MTDKQDRHDDIRSISQRFQSVTTIDPNLNINEQPVNEPTMSKFKNSSSMHSIHEKKKKSCSFDDSWLAKDLPGKNLPEKILFVVDTARETDCTPFETRAGVKFSPLYMIKRIVEIFVTAKSGIQPKHEYALMALKSNHVLWNCDFTNNRKQFLGNLEKLEEDPLDVGQEFYDLGPCCEAICANTDIEENSAIPESVARVILIYARSRSVPIFQTGRNFLDRLYKNSHFYLDSLYVHEPLSDDNNCQSIYAKLGTLDANQTSYILEAGRNLAVLHTNMAKLIAHPLQRARQDDSPYTVYNPPSQDTQTNV